MPGTVVLIALIAQVAPAAVGDPSLDRVRRQLAEPPPRLVATIDANVSRPTFRLSVEGVRPLFLKPPWEPDSAVAKSVRAPHPLYHHEYLMMTTPEEFRASTLYPATNSTIPGLDIFALLRGLSGDNAKAREARERRVREQVRKELEAYKAGLPKP